MKFFVPFVAALAWWDGAELGKTFSLISDPAAQRSTHHPKELALGGREASSLRR